jgi:diaminopimelate decarboxylase
LITVLIYKGDNMDYFRYQGGQVFVEDVEIQKIAAEVGTPVYIYSKATFLNHLKKIQSAYSEIETIVCYSVKACGNINILRFNPSKVFYPYIQKTHPEIIEALNTGIGYFNIESEAELENLIKLADREKKQPKVALRVNPDVQYKTHAYITTGIKETKFGVDIERAIKVFEKYGGNPSVNLCAIHVHLGSGGKTIDPYVIAVEKTLPLIEQLRDKGHKIEALDLGGGYGADYESDTVPSAADYASGIVPLLKNKDIKLILEPGKSICANAGMLMMRVLYIKQGGSKKFVIVDAGMNDLIRPALYDAFHFIWPAKVDEKFVPAQRTKSLQPEGAEVVDIVGPICESGDFFAKDRPLPPVKRGDLLCVFTAGAYGFTMSSNYNARGRAPEVLVDGDKFTVIRKRETYEDQVLLEK